jgi:hypothetical protein
VGPRAGLDAVENDEWCWLWQSYEHIASCEHNSQFRNIKVGGNYSNHCSLKYYYPFVKHASKFASILYSDGVWRKPKNKCSFLDFKGFWRWCISHRITGGGGVGLFQSSRVLRSRNTTENRSTFRNVVFLLQKTPDDGKSRKKKNSHSECSFFDCH